MIIQELLENEKRYVAALEVGIKTYIGPFTTIALPKTLVGKRFIIFSNIVQIFEFHNEKFLPKLLECGFDPEKIADTFTTCIERCQFDNYIVYVHNKTKSQQICKENKYFFMQLDQDLLGINSFLLQPIQRLPRYQLLISELVKELFKDFTKNKNAISRCCIAEKNIYNLLTIVNEQCE